MEDENDVDRSKDLQNRREAYRIKREAETQVEKQNRLESESNKRLAIRSTELPVDVTSRKSKSRTSCSHYENIVIFFFVFN